MFQRLHVPAERGLSATHSGGGALCLPAEDGILAFPAFRNIPHSQRKHFEKENASERKDADRKHDFGRLYQTVLRSGTGSLPDGKGRQSRTDIIRMQIVHIQENIIPCISAYYT